MQRYNYSPKPPTFLSINKQNFSSVILWPHREMHPNSPVAVALDEQFVKLLLRFISVIEENGGIAKRLLHARHLNIHRASR